MQENSEKNQEVVLESLSAVMDGEGGDLDLRRVLKAAASDPGITGAWQRYHLVRASLQQEVHSRPAVNLLAGIHAGLSDNELPAGRPLTRTLARVMRRVGQGAIAASVAFTALYAASYLPMMHNPDSEAGAGSLAGLAVGEQRIPSLGGDFTPSELTRTVSMDAAARRRLQQAVYQSTSLSSSPFAEPYVFPEQDSRLDIDLPPASIE